MIEEAHSQGADAVFLPEACDYIAADIASTVKMSESLEGETMTKFRALAKQLGIVISVGGFHQVIVDLLAQKFC